MPRDPDHVLAVKLANNFKELRDAVADAVKTIPEPTELVNMISEMISDSQLDILRELEDNMENNKRKLEYLEEKIEKLEDMH